MREKGEIRAKNKNTTDPGERTTFRGSGIDTGEILGDARPEFIGDRRCDRLLHRLRSISRDFRKFPEKIVRKNFWKIFRNNFHANFL